VNLVFDAKSHKYYDEQGELPSVTRILSAEGITPDFSGLDISYAERGTRVHKACEAIDCGRQIPPCLPEEAGYLEAYRKYLRDSGAVWSHVELVLAHPIYRYAGTLDRAYPLLDIKTGAPGSGEPLQLAAYWDLLAANEGYSCKPEGKFLYLSNEGTYKLETVTGLNRLARIFQAVLTSYNYKLKRRK
jgi:hypothetical protein